jgi:hypothetical protein
VAKGTQHAQLCLEATSELLAQFGGGTGGHLEALDGNRCALKRPPKNLASGPLTQQVGKGSSSLMETRKRDRR